MTREEAINRLTNTLQEMRAFFLDSKHISEDDEKDLASMEMAIEALEQEPCDKYIKEIDHLHKYISKLETQIVMQEPKTGYWIETAEEYYKAVNEYGGGVNEYTQYFLDDIACSVCLAMYSVIDNETERFDFCPSCGSKMVDPKESEV